MRTVHSETRASHVREAAAIAPRSRRSITKTIMQEAASSTGQEAAAGAEPAPSLSAVVEVGELSGKRLIVEFSAFGNYNVTCQLELRANGDSAINKGMVMLENGAWRIEVCTEVTIPFMCFFQLLVGGDSFA